MNSDQMIVEQLDQLGRALGSAPGLVDSVMREVRQSSPQASASAPGRWTMKRSWAALAGAAAVVFVVAGWRMLQPPSAYARMLEALAKAKTVHMTGWTKQLVRKWPLEGEKPRAGAEDKYPIEVWYWTDADGTPRSYERHGPVYLVRRGGEFREYQSDVPLTFVHRGGYSKDRVAKVTGMAEYLSRLERPSLKKEELGTRVEQGRQMYGLRFSEGQVVEEWWIDEQTDLPRRLLRTSRQTGETQLEINITADEPPPAAIVNYEPPATKEMRYGGRQDETALAWRRHVEELGAQLEAEPPAGAVAIVPRENGLTFSVQWPLRTPDGRRWIAPLDVSQDTPMTMAYLVKFRLSEGSGERRDGAWRLAKGLHDVKIPRADLVYEDGTPWREWAAYVLDRHGLELVDEEQPRTIWVAKHDGRQFKPWREVKPPVPYIVEGGVEKKGVVRPGVGYILHPVTLTGSSGLLEEFNRMIDRNDLAADKPWIVDETGLPTPPTFDKAKHTTWEEYWGQEIEGKHAAATDAPYFVGNESLEMARQWYEKEFGVTFEERTETQTVHVIRRKQ